MAKVYKATTRFLIGLTLWAASPVESLIRSNTNNTEEFEVLLDNLFDSIDLQPRLHK